MKSTVFASALVVASAETVNLTYKDCGSSSTHGKITSLTPDSIDVPGKATIVGSGALDADQTSASFSLKVKKGIIPFVSGKGNLCEDTSISLPLGAGSFTVKGLECPIKAGSVNVEVDLDLASSVFEDGENSLLTIHIDANADDTGDQVLCLDVDASLALAAEHPSVTGACSADEQAALADPQVVGDKANTCGTTAFNIITGKFDHDKFNSCFTSSSQGSATPAVKPVQVARVSCAGSVQDKQPDLHQPRRQSALQFFAPYSPVAA
jgi:hypothetical protein